MPDSTVSRRAVLAGACAGCVGLIAGCSGAGASSGSSSSGGAGKKLVALKDVPLGGGVVVKGPSGQVVVAQPTAGQVVAFSAVCTHQGGIVHVDGQQLVCPVHGSIYSLADGSVEQGPAPRPLPKVAVQVSGAEVVTA